MKIVWIGIVMMVLVGCAKQELKPIEYSKVGTKYLFGIGGASKDLSKALFYHKKACSQGYALSCGMVGWIYEDNTEVTKSLKQNLPLAKQWYIKACNMGEKSACNAVTRVEALIKGDPCNMAISSFINHAFYIHEHNYKSNEVCKHVMSAIHDNMKILKICSRDILRQRGYYKERNILMHSSSDLIIRCKLGI